MSKHSLAYPAHRASTVLVIAAAVVAAIALGATPAFGAPEPPDPEGAWKVTQSFTTSELGPRDIAVSPDGEHLFVGFEDASALSIVDLADNSSIDKALESESEYGPGQAEPILVVPADDSYRVLAAGLSDIYSVTPDSWGIASEEISGIESLAYSESTGKVYSISGGSQLAEHDPLTGELLRWASLDDF